MLNQSLAFCVEEKMAHATTIHPRWDMELFSYLFSSEDEDEIE